MKKISVLIPDSEIGHALVVARSLALIKEIEIHALSIKNSPAIKYSNRIRSFRKLKVDENNDISLEELFFHIRRTNADIVLPIGEEAHRFITLNKKEIELVCKTSPVSPIEIFDKVTDKWQLANFLLNNDIPCPKTILLKKESSLEDQIKDSTFPLIVKPSKGYGGLGIKKIKNFEDLKEFLATNTISNLGDYIAQEFIDGYDIDCSLLAKEGKILAATIQKGFIPRTGKFAAPAGIQFLKNSELLGVVEKFTRITNYSGIAHIDLRYDINHKNFKIIEINARFWGSLTGSQIVGVNFPYLTVLAGLEIDFEYPDYKIGRYIDHTTAAKKMLKEIFSNKKDKVKYRETDFKFIFSDLIAEIYNIYARRI